MSNYGLDTDDSKSIGNDDETDGEPVTVTFGADYDEFFPPGMTEYEPGQWAPPTPNGKQPLAVEYSGLRSKQQIEDDPDSDGDSSEEPNYCSWSDERVTTTFDHARDLRENDEISRYGAGAGLIFVLQNQRNHYFGPEGGDPFCLIDFDDAVRMERITERKDEDGEIIEIRATFHPVAWRIIERGGFGAFSSSAIDPRNKITGAHCYVEGRLSEGVKAISDDLPEHPDFPGASIEVYDGGRCIRATPYHIPGTARDVQPAQDLLDDLPDAFDASHAGSPGVDREPAHDRPTIRETNYTTDIEDVYDAIYHVDRRDITLRSDVTGENGGYTEYDPSWRDSDSGTSLAWSERGHWIDRSGMQGLDAMHVVALEEGITSDESRSGYPSGAKWWDAIDALRDRGAHIPELIQTTGEFLSAQLDGFEPTPEDRKRLEERQQERRGDREAAE